MKEVKALKKLSGHPQFIKLVGACTTDLNNYIILQHAWGDLGRYIRFRGPFPEVTAKNIFKQLLKGIKVSHIIIY
jgi:serine/threonine protein kinase